MENTFAYRAGELAAQRGCYRLLMAPESPQEEAEWLAGYDAAKKAGQRGSTALPALPGQLGGVY